MYRSFASVHRFIPRYFIPFVAMVNGINFLISLSELSLLVYRNVRDFCVSFVYPATLLNSLMSYSSFLVFRILFVYYPWRRKWQSTPALLPGKSHGRRSLIGYSPWGRQESDMTERLHFTCILSCHLQAVTVLLLFQFGFLLFLLLL